MDDLTPITRRGSLVKRRKRSMLKLKRSGSGYIAAITMGVVRS